MPRQTHVATAWHSVYLPYAANAADLAMTAADVANYEEVVHTGKEIVVCHNTSAGALTVTFESVNNEHLRTGDITAFSIGAGEYAIFGPFPLHGWRQADGKLYFRASAATIKLGVYRL